VLKGAKGKVKILILIHIKFISRVLDAVTITFADAC
jgi:hypothetical protein